jgi:hypothetical protein
MQDKGDFQSKAKDCIATIGYDVTLNPRNRVATTLLPKEEYPPC